jgi:20S proteasome alpha/beta subunit
MQTAGFPSEEFPLRPYPFKPFIIPEPGKAAPLTTVVAAKCAQGIVIACDSQGTSLGSQTKTLDVNKIIPIADGSGKNALLLASSGSEDDIALLKEAVANSAKNRQFEKDSEIRGEMTRILRELFKKHNTERSIDMGLSRVQNLWEPDSVLAVKFAKPDKAGQLFGLYHLRFDGLAVPVEKYHTLGSGSTFADFLLGMNERFLPLLDLGWKDMNLMAMETSLVLVVNQVKSSDLYSGGPTRVAMVDKEGAHELSVSDLLAIQQAYIKIAEEKLSNGSELEKALLKMLKALVGGGI